jgi:starch synthase
MRSSTEPAPNTPDAAPTPDPQATESPSPPVPGKRRSALAQAMAHPPQAPQAPGPVPAAPPPAAAAPRPLYVVQVAPECAPVAKVGGLADVVFGLARELEIRGNHVEIVLPKYASMRYDQIVGLTPAYENLWVPWYEGAIRCTVFFGFVHGRRCFFVEPHSPDNYFGRERIYGFHDDLFRFAFFSRAAMEFLWRSGKHPDVIHCHDWQTALVPVYLYEFYEPLGMRHPRACLTIHNFQHQGLNGMELLRASGLHHPEKYFRVESLRDNYNPFALNLLKGGIVYANAVTTVSQRHAIETRDQGQGFGLEPTLQHYRMKYRGVTNGIDYDMWNPEVDQRIPKRFGADDMAGKTEAKRALRQRLLLAENDKPVVAFIGRLDPQKGLELVRHGIFHTLHRQGQFVLLGSAADDHINGEFWGAKRHLNDNPDCHLEIGFDDELARLIYAGADILIVPSRFEPCGLTQLIAMRYGTIPVVRDVGGLADTVFDADHSPHPAAQRNGYVFRDYDNRGLESALDRALDCYQRDPARFRELQRNAMKSDYSWNRPGLEYLEVYDFVRNK